MVIELIFNGIGLIWCALRVDKSELNPLIIY
jgi:hypothetical protein